MHSDVGHTIKNVVDNMTQNDNLTGSDHNDTTT